MHKHKSGASDVLGLFERIIEREDTKFAVLAWFLRNKKETVYPALLARLIFLPEASVRRMLNLLTRKRILADRPTRYRHYFRLHPIWVNRHE